MTSDQIIQKSNEYVGLIKSRHPLAKPIKINEIDTPVFGGLSGIDHLYWMCEEIKQIARKKDKTEKAMRWLGFIQGSLWFAGEFSIRELKSHNRSLTKV